MKRVDVKNRSNGVCFIKDYVEDALGLKEVGAEIKPGKIKNISERAYLEQKDDRIFGDESLVLLGTAPKQVDPDADLSKEEVKGLLDRQANDVITYIKRSRSVTTLRIIAARTDRKTVEQAVKKQLAALEKKTS